jgi:hypothetical protein
MPAKQMQSIRGCCSVGEAAGHGRAQAEAPQQVRGAQTAADGRDHEREHAYPGLQRAVAEDELKVLREHQLQPDQREHREQHAKDPDGEAALGEQADVEERMGKSALTYGEPAEQRHAAQQDRDRREEADGRAVPGLLQAEGQEEDAEDGQRRAGGVPPVARVSP